MEKALLKLEKGNKSQTVDGFFYIKIRFLIFKKVLTAWRQGDVYSITNE